MLKKLEARLDVMKMEITTEVATKVVAEVKRFVDLLRSGGPEAVSKPEACFRLGIKSTKLKGMIRRGEIAVCELGDSELIPMVEIRRLTQPVVKPQATRRRGGGRKKNAAYDPLADYEALGRRGKKR